MPFYKYESEDGEQIEKFQQMSEMSDYIEENGKIYYRLPEFSGGFILRGQGWASKGNATAGSPKHGKEVGLKVDYDKKNEMQEAGELKGDEIV